MYPLIPHSLNRLVTAAVGVLVIGGLFAMHGLGGHGSGTHDAMTSVDASALTHASASVLANAIDAPAMSEAATANATDEVGGIGNGLAVLCLVIQAAALVVFALVLERHLRRRPLCSVEWTHPEVTLVESERDPPDLLRLAVMRC